MKDLMYVDYGEKMSPIPRQDGTTAPAPGDRVAGCRRYGRRAPVRPASTLSEVLARQATDTPTP